MPFGFKTTRELIADLREEVRNLSSAVKSIEQEWDEFYDKATRKAARERKRARDEEEQGAARVPEPAHDNGTLPRGVLIRRRQYGVARTQPGNSESSLG